MRVNSDDREFSAGGQPAGHADRESERCRFVGFYKEGTWPVDFRRFNASILGSRRGRPATRRVLLARDGALKESLSNQLELVSNQSDECDHGERTEDDEVIQTSSRRWNGHPAVKGGRGIDLFRERGAVALQLSLWLNPGRLVARHYL